MADEVPYGRKTQKAPAISDVHIVWITAGLGCDGDSVSITAATQPSLEDVVLGAVPGLPKVHLHNPVLAYEVGDDFMKFLYQAEQGLIDPFVLVIEGSIPNEKIKSRGLLGGIRHRRDDRAADNDLRMDRPAGPEIGGHHSHRNMRHLRRYSRYGGQSDRGHGVGGLSRVGL